MRYTTSMRHNTPSSQAEASSPRRMGLQTPPRKYSTVPAARKAELLAGLLVLHKGGQVTALHIGDNPCVDAVVTATAMSARHARSLAEAVIAFAGNAGYEYLRTEGRENARWILVDLNDVVVHIFQQEDRDLYRIESLYREAATLRPAPEAEVEAVHGASSQSASRAVPAVFSQASAPAALRPTLLLILDGYGLADPGPGNAVALAHTPHLHRLLGLPGATRLEASGSAVGLPAGYMGNSEVGHLNIGAGRVVYQDMTRIDMAVDSGELARNPVLVNLMDTVRARGGRVHFMGLLSDGGVHSHIRHLCALLEAASAAGVPAVAHGFLDGRDTPPARAGRYLAELRPVFERTGTRPGVFVGRFYAMDRDKRWDRVKTAWDALVHGQARPAVTPEAGLEAAYAAGESDEFVKPFLVGDPAEVCVADNDGVFFFNFRADRARELAAAFLNDDFGGFDRGRRPATAGLAGMTCYDASFDMPAAFGRENLKNTLGEVVSALGLRQLRIAETEKYAHVTYFFSGGREEPFPGEDRILVPSPKDVPTYDLKPEMSVAQVADKLIDAWNTGAHTLAVCNLANPDMVGHTGNLPAAVAALEAVDVCVGRIAAAVEKSGGRLAIVADHGNAEAMLDDRGLPQTAHTCNPVPMIVIQDGAAVPLRSGGRLGDIAPTLLALWKLPRPEAMTGEVLLAAEENA